MQLIFWLSLFIVFYTFLGYGFLLSLLVKIKRKRKGKTIPPVIIENTLPSCSLIIAAFNEESCIRQKIANTLSLIYPREKLTIIFITDGSNDSTPDIVAEYPEICHLHLPQRNGKIAAVHRAMAQVHTEVVVFTDANTLLNKHALVNICRHYADPNVGAVAGEKRIQINQEADASSAGEGFYWKYESTLKRWDSELYSVVGAAGELFSVRKDLYKPVKSNAILDDFMISMLIAKEGYRIIYEPHAFAIETASENVTEELKRKIRIAAGGIQSIVWLSALLNIFKYKTLSFQYISHRVLRWTITPFLLILSLFINILLVYKNQGTVYEVFLSIQVIFYSMAILGLIFEKRKMRIKALFIPYYFCVMNYAVLAGIIRYINKSQSAIWEKAKRKE